VRAAARLVQCADINVSSKAEDYEESPTRESKLGNRESKRNMSN
jgi:hypothetical protein